MNGAFTNILLTAIGGLLGLVQVLLWLLLKAHVDSDKAALASVEETIRLRFAAHTEVINRIDVRNEQVSKRVHDLTAIVGKVEQQQRFHDEDKHEG